MRPAATLPCTWRRSRTCSRPDADVVNHVPMDDAARCPCLTGLPYGECCGPLHVGVRTAGTAEALMRSRYAAFAVGDASYLLQTWHPTTRPAVLELDPQQQWRRLDVLSTRGGGPFDDDGEVEFVATFRSAVGASAGAAADGGPAAGRGRLHEVSRFVREGGRWFYVDGDVSG
jgi:SEC-C motif domain protein